MAKEKKIIGWREWVCFPSLGIPFIKAKVDTGARTSSLHAYHIEYFKKNGQDWVRFKVHPEQRSTSKVITAEAELHDERLVKSSSGHQSKRPVIITKISLVGEEWPIEITLANRDEMGFRMLLGRQGFRDHMLVDAGKSYYSNKPTKKRKR